MECRPRQRKYLTDRGGREAVFDASESHLGEGERERKVGEEGRATAPFRGVDEDGDRGLRP
jgi:hypothetical protein